MPWHIESDNPACAGFAVVKDSDGEVEGCHRTREQALRHLAALNLVEAEDDDAEGIDDDDENLANEVGIRAAESYAANRSATPNADLVREMLAPRRTNH